MKSYIWFFLKIALISLFAYFSNPIVYERIVSIDSFIGKIVFVVIWVASVVSLFLLAFIERASIRFFSGAILSTSAFIGLAYFFVSGTWLGFPAFTNLIVEIGSADDAVSHFEKQVFDAFLISLLGFFAFLLPSGISVHGRLRYFVVLIGVAPVILVSGVLYARGGEGTNGLPNHVNTLAFTLMYIGDELLSVNLEREDVSYEASASLADNIFYIIDESISGDFLDINSNRGVYTSLGERPYVYNFGVVSSISNCSSSSNWGLRYGISRSSPLEDAKTNPSVWAYAKKAGYKTIYIDAQRYESKLQNYMTHEELGDVDEFYQIARTDNLYLKDMEVVKYIRRLSGQPGKKFVLINKTGAHFPYEGKYPPEHAVYSPTMSNDFQSDDSAPDMRKLAEIDIDKAQPSLLNEVNKLKVLNSYKNTIRWTVGEFFNRVFIDDEFLLSSVVIYTSDHGQGFNGNSQGRLSPHCSPPGSAAREEGRVPLVFLTRIPSLSRKLEEASRVNSNKVSLFSVAPTIFKIMGYSGWDISTDNGFEKDLFELRSKPDKREFLTDMIVKFGRKPSWQSID